MEKVWERFLKFRWDIGQHRICTVILSRIWKAFDRVFSALEL